MPFAEFWGTEQLRDPTTAPAVGRGRLVDGVRTGASGLVVLVGLAVLCGAALSGGSPGWTAMEPTTALCCLLLGVAGLLPRGLPRARGVGRLVRVPALTAAVLAVISTVAYPLRLGADHAGRMAVATALSLLLVSAAQVLPGRYRRPYGEVLPVPVLVITGTAMLGYLYGASSLYDVAPYSRMALHTAALLFVLAVAAIAAVPDGAASWLVTGDDAGAMLVRRVLPVVLVAIPLAGYLCRLGQVQGLYGTTSAFAILAVVAIALVSGTCWYTARLLSQIDGRRRRALSALTQVNVGLEERVQERAAELEAERGRSAVLDDRQRIAADMHDHVIQGLYAVALSLHAAVRRGGAPVAVDSAVLGIDEAIRDLRASIFELKHPLHAGDLVARLERLVEHAGSNLPDGVQLTSRGELGDLSDVVAENLVAATREALSNAVRHAKASRVSVDVEAAGGEVVVAVSDDGSGIDPAVESTSGMRNMRARAEELGGSCVWARRTPSGTTVTWRVPVTAAQGGRAASSSESSAASPVGSPRLSGSDPAVAERLLRVLGQVTGRLARAGPEGLWWVVGDAARTLVDAPIISVVTQTACDELLVLAAEGLPHFEDTVGTVVPKEAALAGHVIDTGEPLRVDQWADVPDAVRVLGHKPFGPLVIVPLTGPAGERGALVLARMTGSPPFTAGEMDLAAALARFLSVAFAEEGAVASGAGPGAHVDAEPGPTTEPRESGVPSRG